MIKLVWIICHSDNCTYSNNIPTPFEYSSKDDFIYHVLELIEKAKAKGEFSITPFHKDDYVDLENIGDLEKEIMTVEEWFEKEKQILIN